MSWLADIFNVHGYIAFATGLISGVLAPFLMAATSITTIGDKAADPVEVAEPSLSAPFFILLLIALSGAPIAPMLDTTTLKVLPDSSRYGEARIWGSVGYGLFAFTTGFVIDRFGVGTNFYIYAVNISLAGISLSISIFRSRGVRAPAKYGGGGGGEERAVEEEDFGAQKPAHHGSETVAALKGMLSKPNAKQLFFVIFVYGIAHSVINNMVPMFLTKDLEASGSVVGVALVLALCGEVPCFLTSQRVLTMFKDGPYSVLTMAHLVMAGRLLVYALASKLRFSGLALVVQLVHGMTFSLPWASFVLIVNSIAPQGFGTTVQSILHALFVGVAGSTGAFVGSFCYSVLGSTCFFLAVACVVLLSYFFVLSRMPRNYSPQIISTQDFDS